MKTSVVLVGDLLAIAVVTLIGFATHGEAVPAFLPRMLVLFLPLSIAWLALAPFFGLFRAQVIADPRQVWRGALVMIFAVPAALVVRGMLLNAPILPIFALILSGVSALGMLLWRGVAMLIVRARKS
jgi:hypothetical protein